MALQEFVLRAAGRGLFPTSPQAEEYIEQIGTGREVMAKLWTPRNMNRHKRFWALMHEASKNVDGYADAEELLDALKILCGMYVVLGVSDEMKVVKPVSTKFNSMDEIRFQRFERRIMDTLAKEFGFIPEDLRAETDRLLAHYGKARK